MAYLRKLWRSRTVKLALAEMVTILGTFLAGKVGGEEAIFGALMAVGQIGMRVITSESVNAK